MGSFEGDQARAEVIPVRLYLLDGRVKDDDVRHGNIREGVLRWQRRYLLHETNEFYNGRRVFREIDIGRNAVKRLRQALRAGVGVERDGPRGGDRGRS